MKAAASVLCGVMVIGCAGGAFAQSAPLTDERAFVGATWSGGAEADVEGYESYGGSYVLGATAVSVFRSRTNPGEWILVSKLETGRTAQHALWRGLDTIRVSVDSAQGTFAYECRLASAATGWEPGLIGFVGSVESEPGVLRAEQAIRFGADGRLTRVNEPVVCADEAAGI